MWPHLSQRWCEVSQRIGEPQLSHGASPARGGWQAGAVAGCVAGRSMTAR